MVELTKRTRKNPRIACNAAAVVITARGTYTGVCESLSPAGAFVRCGQSPSEDRLKMVVCLPSLGPVEVEAEVLYRQPEGCGIRFVGLGPGALNAICTYMGTKAA